MPLKMPNNVELRTAICGKNNVKQDLYFAGFIVECFYLHRWDGEIHIFRELGSGFCEFEVLYTENGPTLCCICLYDSSLYGIPLYSEIGLFHGKHHDLQNTKKMFNFKPVL